MSSLLNGRVEFSMGVYYRTRLTVFCGSKYGLVSPSKSRASEICKGKNGKQKFFFAFLHCHQRKQIN